MTHKLPELQYAYNALEPYIDAQTMEIHHTKHHQTYVDKLNAALEGYEDLQDKNEKEGGLTPGFMKRSDNISAWKLGNILNRSKEVVIDRAFLMTTSFYTLEIK